MREEGQAGDAFLVALERVALVRLVSLPGVAVDLPDLDRTGVLFIAAGHGQDCLVLVRGECDGGDRAGMVGQREGELAGGGVPELDGAVAPAGGQECVLGVQGQALHPVIVGANDRGAGGLLGVPHLDLRVHAPRDERAGFLREGQGRDGAVVADPFALFASVLDVPHPNDEIHAPRGEHCTVGAICQR